MINNLPLENISREAEVIYNCHTGRQQRRLLFHYISYTLPKVNRLLTGWKEEARLCSEPELRAQALASIAGKDFHCQGGAVFTVPYPQQEDNLIELIVAYQTLCDYLDNLCDRANCLNGVAFRELHQSLYDALTPGGKTYDYYCSYPYKDDGGYINKLVETCRRSLHKLPSYQVVYDDVMLLAQLYSELQVRKHIALEAREESLINWANGNLGKYPGVLWQEFAAASGSTLALFALLGLAAREDVSREESHITLQTYFPWICGLHILLDYFIDQEEDRQGGDLNFTFYYPDNRVTIERLKLFIRKAHAEASQLTFPFFEKTVIEGLLAMYLSDKKIKSQGFKPLAKELINESGRGAWKTYHLCSLVRKFV